jgi:hypothetical protein
MRLLVLTIGLLLPLETHAALELLPFTQTIWAQACAVLPYCGSGGTGVIIVTGMITKAVLWTIGAGATVVILYASARIVSSAGNEEVLGKSKKIIFYATLGILFAILASTIVNYLIALVSGIATAV